MYISEFVRIKQIQCISCMFQLQIGQFKRIRNWKIFTYFDIFKTLKHFNWMIICFIGIRDKKKWFEKMRDKRKMEEREEETEHWNS